MTPEQSNTLAEIKRLLKEAYDDYFARSDGCCKSSEGYVEIYYPNIFEAARYGTDEAKGIGIYSYVLGPSRMHTWHKKESGSPKGNYADKWCDDPFRIALEDVRRWHREQLEWREDD